MRVGDKLCPQDNGGVEANSIQSRVHAGTLQNMSQDQQNRKRESILLKRTCLYLTILGL